MVEKISVAACSGLSANGLVSRVACGDCRKSNDGIVSICMASTAANKEEFNNEILKKYPIIAVNGCDGSCVNKILKDKRVDVTKTIDVKNVLDETKFSANDPYRLDEEGEICVKIILALSKT